jgi:hypothetical protein
MRTICISFLAFLVTLSSGACARPRREGLVNRHRADIARLPDVRRIAILRIDPGPAPEKSVELIQRTLRTMLTRRYEVVEFQPPRRGLVEPAGRILIDNLLLAHEKLGADALLAGEIINYRRHEPPAITMSLKLISTEDATVLWAASGTVDAARPDVEKRIRDYYSRTQESGRNLFGWRTVLLAERRYVQFVANEFLLTINPQRRP